MPLVRLQTGFAIYPFSINKNLQGGFYFYFYFTAYILFTFSHNEFLQFRENTVLVRVNRQKKVSRYFSID